MIPRRSSKHVPTWWGPAIMVVSAILFAVMAMTVKIAGQLGIPGPQTTFIRFVFGIATVVTLHFLGVARIRFQKPVLLALRGVTGGIAILLYFLSLSAAGTGNTTLTNAVLLGNAFFVFTPIFGAIFLKEKLRSVVVVSVIAAFAGLYLVVHPNFASIRIGDFYGFTSAIFAAAAIIVIRQLSKSEPTHMVFLSLCVVGAVISGIVAVGTGMKWPTPMGWLVLLVMAVMATVGQLMQTYAFAFVPAGEGSLLAMTSVIYTTLGGILFFSDPFNTRIAVGAILVFAAATYLTLSSKPQASL